MTDEHLCKRIYDRIIEIAIFTIVTGLIRERYTHLRK